jgi:hypothetical protein
LRSIDGVARCTETRVDPIGVKRIAHPLDGQLKTAVGVVKVQEHVRSEVAGRPPCDLPTAQKAFAQPALQFEHVFSVGQRRTCGRGPVFRSAVSNAF